MHRIRYRLWSLLDRISLPSFLPYRWHLAYARWTLAGTERMCGEVLAVPDPPSYHDLYITTPEIERTSIFNLPYGFEISCTRVGGWALWDSGDRLSPHMTTQKPRKLGGEYDGDKWLVLDIDGQVIVDSRPGSQSEED